MRDVNLSIAQSINIMQDLPVQPEQAHQSQPALLAEDNSQTTEELVFGVVLLFILNLSFCFFLLPILRLFT
jgi:hypothetical protein